MCDTFHVIPTWQWMTTGWWKVIDYLHNIDQSDDILDDSIDQDQRRWGRQKRSVNSPLDSFGKIRNSQVIMSNEEFSYSMIGILGPINHSVSNLPSPCRIWIGHWWKTPPEFNTDRIYEVMFVSCYICKSGIAKIVTQCVMAWWVGSVPSWKEIFLFQALHLSGAWVLSFHLVLVITNLEIQYVQYELFLCEPQS